MAWSHSSSAYQQGWFVRDGGGYDVTKYTTALLADTWYGIGGRVSGVTLSAWLNGVNEKSVSTISSGGLATNDRLCLLAAFAGSNYWIDGTMAEFAFWTSALSDGEMASLGNGISPALISPGSRLHYLPLVRNIFDVDGAAFTSLDTTVSSHPRIIYPRRRQAFSVAAAAPTTASLQHIYRHVAGIGA